MRVQRDLVIVVSAHLVAMAACFAQPACGWMWKSRTSAAFTSQVVVADTSQQRLVEVAASSRRTNWVGWSSLVREWGGARWTEIAPSPTGPRFVFAECGAAYDSTRARVIAFGGSDTTWAWNGVSWSEVVSTVRPSLRTQPALAYDRSRDRIVMFGGRDSSRGISEMSDTWEHDGTKWVHRPIPGPPGRYGASMWCDRSTKELVLVGGVSGTGAPRTDVWRFDGSVWRPGEQLPIGWNTYLWRGGTDGEGNIVQSGASAWKRVEEWTPLFTTGPVSYPSSAVFGLVGIDPGTGGIQLSSARTLNFESWLTRLVWDKAGWRTIAQDAPRTVRYGFAWDEASQRLLAFGGHDFATDNFPLDMGRFLDGDVWEPAVLGGANIRGAVNHVMSSDRMRREVVLFGPPFPGNVHTTWVLRSGSWIALETNGPSDRSGAAMADDFSSGSVVMFGGLVPGSSPRRYLGDTWLWNGTRWAPGPTTGPSSREDAAMCFDPARNVVVLFGGNNGSDVFDTWEYSAGTWVQRNASGPTVRRGSLAFHPGLGSPVLVGGLSASGAAGAWKWNGSVWEQIIDAAVGPRLAVGSGLAEQYYLRAQTDWNRGTVVAWTGSGTAQPYTSNLISTAYEIVPRGKPSIEINTDEVTVRRGSPWVVPVAISDGGPYSAVWRKNGEVLADGLRSDGSAVWGVTGRTLSITKVQRGDAGVYQVRVGDRCGDAAAETVLRTTCVSDFNLDFTVDDLDFHVLASAYDAVFCSAAHICVADLTSDGVVDDSDFQKFVVEYGILSCE